MSFLEMLGSDLEMFGINLGPGLPQSSSVEDRVESVVDRGLSTPPHFPGLHEALRVVVPDRHIEAKILKMAGINMAQLGSRFFLTSQSQSHTALLNKIYNQLRELKKFHLEVPNHTAVDGRVAEVDAWVQAKERLDTLVRLARHQISDDQYKAIREKYSNPICFGFFQKLNDTIKANYDRATVSLGRTLNIPPDFDASTPFDEELILIREWLNNPDNADTINNTTEIALNARNLHVVPRELSKFSNLRKLDLSVNNLKEVTLPNNIPRLERLYLDFNQLREVKLPEKMTALRILYLSHNKLKEVKLPENMPELRILYLSHNKLKEVKLPSSPVLEVVNLSENLL